MISISDFYPLRVVVISDFYPEGYSFPSKPNRRIPPQIAGSLIAIYERLQRSLEAEIELLSMMEFCAEALNMRGIRFAITRVNPTSPASPAGS